MFPLGHWEITEKRRKMKEAFSFTRPSRQLVIHGKMLSELALHVCF